MSTQTRTNEHHQLPLNTTSNNIEDIAIKENMQSNNINNNKTMMTSNNNETTTSNMKNLTPPLSTSTTSDEPKDSILSNNDTKVESDIVIDSTDKVPTTTITTTTITTNTTTDPVLPTTTTTAVPALTYMSSKESIYYQTANVLLQRGDFEMALSTIEDGIEWTKQQIKQQHIPPSPSLPKEESSVSCTTSNSSSSSIIITGTNTNDDSLHESLAPFHYLYGTTLLYSIEESNDGLQQPLTTMEGHHQQQSGGDTEVAATMIGDDDEDDDDEAVHIPYDGNTNITGGVDDDDNDDQPVIVEDMEIAWENLDTARMIVEQMLHNNPTCNQLRTDMGQILLREGDLQRQNGAYLEAITDYTNCLAYYENNNEIQPYSHKIADVHCNLGAVYFTVVVEIQKGTLDSNNETTATTSNYIGTTNDALTLTNQERDRLGKISFYRNRGFYHYYECSKTLVGIILELVSINPLDMFQRVSEQHSFSFSYCDEHHEDYPKMIRSTLSSLRKEVMTMIKSINISLSKDISDRINDSLLVLEEIQETIDEAETSEQGVIEATAMKEEITTLVASQQQPSSSSSSEDKETTPMVNVFGSISAMASTAIAQPINNNMIVKKKQKKQQRIENIEVEHGIDIKPPAKTNENDLTTNNKRMKINNE
jgi:tetratricopeptide (TPR) repeat protein